MKYSLSTEKSIRAYWFALILQSVRGLSSVMKCKDDLLTLKGLNCNSLNQKLSSENSVADHVSKQTNH